MKFTRILTPCVVLLLVLLAACSGGTPKKSRCDVEVYTPFERYSQAKLLSSNGKVIDSTLVVKNDSIRFSRNDTANMPYVALLILNNPSDTLDIVSMPIVIEGGTVKLELSNNIKLGGTEDNDALYQFQKAKNSFMKREGEVKDPEQFKKDTSKFISDQAILNKDNMIGDYIFRTYLSFLTPEDMIRVKSALKN